MNGNTQHVDGIALPPITDCAFTLSRELIEAGNTQIVLDALHAMSNNLWSEKFREILWNINFSNNIDFRITGYEHDSRKLSEIPEVKSFFINLVEEWLHRGINALPLLFSLLCRVHITTIPVQHGFEFVVEDEMTSTISDLITELSEHGRNLYSSSNKEDFITLEGCALTA